MKCFFFRNTGPDAYGNEAPLTIVRDAIKDAIKARLADQNSENQNPPEATNVMSTNSKSSFEDLLTNIASKKTPVPTVTTKDPIDIMLGMKLKFRFR